MFYPLTTRNIEHLVRRGNSEIKPVDVSPVGTLASEAYLLFKIKQIQSLQPNNKENASRASRVLGWVIAHAQVIRGVSEKEVQGWIELDERAGLHVAHSPSANSLDRVIHNHGPAESSKLESKSAGVDSTLSKHWPHR